MRHSKWNAVFLVGLFIVGAAHAEVYKCQFKKDNGLVYIAVSDATVDLHFMPQHWNYIDESMDKALQSLEILPAGLHANDFHLPLVRKNCKTAAGEDLIQCPLADLFEFGAVPKPVDEKGTLYSFCMVPVRQASVSFREVPNALGKTDYHLSLTMKTDERSVDVSQYLDCIH